MAYQKNSYVNIQLNAEREKGQLVDSKEIFYYEMPLPLYEVS